MKNAECAQPSASVSAKTPFFWAASSRCRYPA